MRFLQYLKEQTINEGGDSTLVRKDGSKVHAQDIDMIKTGRSAFIDKFVAVFKELNKRFYAIHKKKLWDNEENLITGKMFNGSTSYIFDKSIPDEELLKYKKKSGDLDLIIPETLKKELVEFLKSIEGEEIIEGVTFLGIASVFDAVIGLFKSNFGDYNVNAQVDFEPLPVDENGDPTEWARFSHSSSFDDQKLGYKGGVGHKYFLTAVAGALSTKTGVIVLQPGATLDNYTKKIKKNVNDIRVIKFSVGRGVRVAYERFNNEDGTPMEIEGKEVYREMKTSESNYETNVDKIFKIIFTNLDVEKTDKKKFWSLDGLIKLANEHLPPNSINLTMERMVEMLWGDGTQKGTRSGQPLSKFSKKSDEELKTGIYNHLKKTLKGYKEPSNVGAIIKKYYDEFKEVEKEEEAYNPQKFGRFLKKTEEKTVVEAKGKMLDISIKAAHKVLINEKNINEFLTSEVTVEEKTDGIKITAMRVANNGQLDDWVLAYKHDIFHDGEFEYLDNNVIKKHSIASSQLKFVSEHFKTINSKSIPAGTELFIEFLMSKPTLSSNYKQKHGMVLIGHSKSTHRIKGNKLFTQAEGFSTDKRNEYAKAMGLDTPALLFVGKMGDVASFENGIKDEKLRNLFNDRKEQIEWGTPELLVKDIGKLLIEVESYYGGETEGVVCLYADKMIKFQKEGQVDQETRNKIKMKYKDDDKDQENAYWDNVRKSALEIIEDIDKSLSFKEQMIEVSKRLRTYEPPFTHSKKNKTHIIDDIQGNCKMILGKRMKGQNGSLISGRFQPFTLGHKKMFDEALKTTDYVVVNIVKGKKSDASKNPFPIDLQKDMINAVFPNEQFEYIESVTGSLITIIGKAEQNVNVVWSGTDRYESYKEQLERNPDMSVKEIKRTEGDVSATKVRDALKADDFETFKSLVPEQIHSFYDKLKTYI